MRHTNIAAALHQRAQLLIVASEICNHEWILLWKEVCLWLRQKNVDSDVVEAFKPVADPGVVRLVRSNPPTPPASYVIIPSS